jgi:hypothetical protein
MLMGAAAKIPRRIKPRNIEEGLRKMEVVILALVIATLGVAAASLGAIGAIFLKND